MNADKTRNTLTCVVMIACSIITTPNGFGQGVSINTTGAEPDSSAMLDVSSTTKGFLPPRMTSAQRDAIDDPATGILVFNIDCRQFQFWDGNAWLDMMNNTAGSAPDIPVATEGSGATMTKINANWNSAAGATHYHLDVSSGNDFVTYVSGYQNLDVGNATTYEVTGLTPATSYFYRVRAENQCASAGNSNTIEYATSTAFTCGSDLFDARDGQSYPTVQIGTQCWMKKNINIGTRINGSSEQSDNSTIDKYCYNDQTDSCAIYGGLYQWAEMVQYLNGATNSASWNPVPAGHVQGICPVGWHVPKDDEWCILENYVEANTDVTCNGWGARGSFTGGHLKEAGTSHWTSPNSGADNGSYFTALPGAYRGTNGTFAWIRYRGFWWAASEYDNSNAWNRHLYNDSPSSYRYYNFKNYGFAVRCLKD